MKQLSLAIFLCALLCAATGCRGVRVDLVPIKAAEAAHIAPQTTIPTDSAAWRVMMRRGKRDIVFTVLTESHKDEGLRVAGLSDLGNTLFLADVAPDGHVTVLSNKTGVSGKRLENSFVRDAIVPFVYINPENAQAYKTEDGRIAQQAITAPGRSHAHVYGVSDGMAQEYWRLHGRRRVYRATCVTPGGGFQEGFEVYDSAQRYSAVYRPLRMEP